MALKRNETRKFGFGDIIIILIVLLVGFAIIRYATGSANKVEDLSYNEIVEKINSKNLNTIKYKGIAGSGNENLAEVSGYYTDLATNTRINYKGILTWEQISSINDLAQDPTNTFKIEKPGIVSNVNFMSILSIIIPIILVVVVAFLLIKTSSNSNNQAFEFSKSRARLNKNPNTKFSDVAGLEEEKEEMIELVDFLKNPAKYYQMGARIPKGVLLCGAPGTGKTLIARAVAGEAGVPFYSISGSDFVEMFVGVGASRVRDMFKIAKQNAPCIIFIDEIDAVGRQRGTGLGGGHDEREQTLNQLLVEMDGFAPNSGIIVMAATNRSDILDPALLRPGRFDRQITISKPDMLARFEILKVHAKNKILSPRVNLQDIARRTPGFSGADLENLLNEAALLAARENCREIKIYHLDEAVDRVIMGPAKKSKKYTPEEKKMVAYHEAGHAVIGLKLKQADRVQKVTIIPRGHAGGYNLMTPEKETFTHTKESLLARISSYLGGRIAEEVVFNQITDGAYDDIKRSTAIARSMVTELGMSSLGPVQYEHDNGQTFLGRDYMSEKHFSDQVALEIDQEVRKIINECYEQGKQIITDNIELLTLIAKHLIEVETLNSEDIQELVETGKLAWWEKKKAKLKQEQDELERRIKEEEEERKDERKPFESSAINESSTEEVNTDNKDDNETR